MNDQVCPNCHLPNAPEMSFCTNCGGTLPASGNNSGNFSGEPAPTMFAAAPPVLPLIQSAPSFSAPPKNSNTSKILLAAAGGGLLLIIAVGVIGATIFYFAVYKKPAKANTEVYTSNSNIKTRSDNTSNSSSKDSAPTIDDFVRSQVGDYKLTNTVPGNPAADGFPGAIEEKQYKYANAAGTFSIHYAIARYGSDTEAQQDLREAIDKYKKTGIKTSEIGTASDNDGKVVGISADMFAKNGLVSRFWTKNEFFIRILGEKKDVESFFAAH